MNRPSLRTITLFIQVALHCGLVVFSTWAREGFAASVNTILQYNQEFMRTPTMIEQLYETNEVRTVSKQVGTQLRMEALLSREQVEQGHVPVQAIWEPLFAREEIGRLAEEAVMQASFERQEAGNSTPLTAREKINIRNHVFSEKHNTSDDLVIEGVAITVAPAPMDELLDIFLDLNEFHSYVPDIFLESQSIHDEHLLRDVGVPVAPFIKYQYSRINIEDVEFSQTLRYEISRSENLIDVAWQIEPKFKHHPEYGQHGVRMNNGRFSIQPYVEQDGTIDENQSMILYHIYIKLDPLSTPIQILTELVREGTTKNVMRALANAMRREAMRR